MRRHPSRHAFRLLTIPRFRHFPRACCNNLQLWPRFLHHGARQRIATALSLSPFSEAREGDAHPASLFSQCDVCCTRVIRAGLCTVPLGHSVIPQSHLIQIISRLEITTTLPTALAPLHGNIACAIPKSVHSVSPVVKYGRHFFTTKKPSVNAAKSIVTLAVPGAVVWEDKSYDE